MERVFKTAPADFQSLVGYSSLAPTDHLPLSLGGTLPHALPGPQGFEVHGTTVLMLRFKEGVVALSDRRATAGNLIMYDHAEKVFALDDQVLIAISGAFARSVEVCRMLKHSFKFYRRATLQPLSLEGKLMEISRALAGNAPMAMNGIGVFLPIVAAYDPETGTFGTYFFDGAGARFQNGSYACAGSGSERIRGIFEYLTRTEGPFENRELKSVLKNGMEMLDIASDLDSATGGFEKTPPVVKVLRKDGVTPYEGQPLADLMKSILSRR